MADLPPSMYDIIAGFAEKQGNALAVVGTDIEVTYTQFLNDIDNVSRYLLSEGLSLGASASVVMESNYLHLVFTFAMDRLGVASCSYSFPFETLMPLEWWRDLKFDCVFSAEEKPAEYAGRWITLKSIKDVPSFPEDGEIPTDRSPETIVHYTTSSGTTGVPKCIPLTREIVMKRAFCLAHLSLGPQVRFFCGFPAGSVGCHLLQTAVLAHGGTLVLWGSEENFVELFNKFKPCNVCLTPNAFRNIVIDGVNNNYSFDFLKTTMTGGVIFDRRLVDGALSVFGKNVINGYGSSETLGCAIGYIHEYTDDNPHLVGRILDNTEIQVVDDNDQILPAGETGIVRSKTDFMVHAYTDGSHSENFRDGFFYPGDLGFLDEQGRLSIVGRTDERINLGGHKIVPEPLEYELSSLPGVKEAAVFQAQTADGMRVCAALVLEGGEQSPESHAQIIQKVKTHMGRLAPQRVIFVSSLPRNASSKIIRHKLAEALEGK